MDKIILPFQGAIWNGTYSSPNALHWAGLIKAFSLNLTTMASRFVELKIRFKFYLFNRLICEKLLIIFILLYYRRLCRTFAIRLYYYLI